MAENKIDYLSEEYWEKLVNQSLIRFFILRALKDSDLHGYLLIKKIQEQSHGFCNPSESTLYPALSQFLKSGLITQANSLSKSKKIYKLTPNGKEAFKIAAKAWNKILPTLSRSTIL